MTKHPKPTILFVEDEDEHFRPVALNLGDYSCQRVKRGDLPRIRELARQWQPVAAVVDWMLYSSSEEAHRLNDATKVAIKRLQAWRPGKQDASSGSAADSPFILPPLSGLDCLPVLREECPGIRIVIFSQHFDVGEVNAAGEIVVAKQLMHGHNLANPEEIARKIRTLLQAL